MTTDQYIDKKKKKWYWVKTKEDQAYFVSLAERKGVSTLRVFDAANGMTLNQINAPAPEVLATLEERAVALVLSAQPNLARDCRTVLPTRVFDELTLKATKQGLSTAHRPSVPHSVLAKLYLAPQNTQKLVEIG